MNQGAELLMPEDKDELVKGPMASGTWDGSWGWWYLGRGEALPQNLGSATSPVPKPLQGLCQCHGVGDTSGAQPCDRCAWGHAGACLGMVISDTSALPCALSSGTVFPKQNSPASHPLLLDRPLHVLRWEGLDLAERLPPGPEPVSAFGCWAGGTPINQGILVPRHMLTHSHLYPQVPAEPLG